MKLSSNSCRNGLTPSDLVFIQKTLRLGENVLNSNTLETEHLLDSESLFQALIEDQAILPVSPKLYFYVLLRHTLKEQQISNPEIADYLGAVLTDATQSENIFSGKQPHFYIIDTLESINNADLSERFFQQVKFANLCLLMSGVFSERLQHREARRGAPGLNYFIATGKSYYQSASTHRLAKEYTLDHVFHDLSESFQEVCHSLQELSDRLFFLSPPPPSDLLGD